MIPTQGKDRKKYPNSIDRGTLTIIYNYFFNYSIKQLSLNVRNECYVKVQ